MSLPFLSNSLPILQVHGDVSRMPPRLLTSPQIPAYGDSGRIEGIYIPNGDKTTSVVGTRRLALLAQLSDRVNASVTQSDIANALVGISREHPADLPFVAVYECTPPPGPQSDSRSYSSSSGSGSRFGELRASVTSITARLNLELCASTSHAPYFAPVQFEFSRAEHCQRPLSEEGAFLLQEWVRECLCRNKRMIVDVDRILADEKPSGPDGELLPTYILQPLNVSTDHVQCVIVVGTSPRKRFDHDYASLYVCLGGTAGLTLGTARRCYLRPCRVVCRGWRCLKRSARGSRTWPS
jgi:hypothetical protein